MKIALISGSIRTGSINTQLIHAMAARMQLAGLSATIIDLKDYEMPIYNGDFEAKHGAPKTTVALAKLMRGHDGIFACSPEYNGSLSPLFKNTFDWLTRIENRDHLHTPVWVIGAAASGPMAGVMVMRQLQYILNRLQCELVPMQMGVGASASAFKEGGGFAREADIERADKQIALLKDRIARKQAYTA